jgi:CDP-diacylglycerol--serine O-phosphatidyltransferase
MRHIPNLITILNLTSGFVAVIFATNGNLLTASWIILAALIFDFLDGFSARLLKAYSVLGKELDSLADIVSFGVAPGLIIYRLIYDSLSLYSLPMIIPAIMPVCAALRLAKFNIDTTQSTTFKGLPTPANAIAVISVVIAGHYSGSSIFRAFSGAPLLLYILTIILSMLMVSRIPLMSLKIVNLRFKNNEGRYILAILIMVSFVIFGTGATTLIIPLYILVSLSLLVF